MNNKNRKIYTNRNIIKSMVTTQKNVKYKSAFSMKYA